MTKVRRFWAVVGFLGLVAIISSSLHGQPGKKAGASGLTPQLTPASKVSQLGEATDSRFAASDVLTYQPLKGDLYFALRLQPKLDPSPRRARDIVIVMSTAATQAGPSWVAAQQIADGIIETAGESDRISLCTASTPENTHALTKNEFLLPKDVGEGKRLRDVLKQYRNKEFPAGDTDLKNALSKAIESFEANKDRQRILLFLGDGLSTHNPLEDKDRLALARQLVAKKIAFFPVPLGTALDPKTLHGLANSTGGVVLRTGIAEEKLTDALARYEQAFAGAILYSAEIQMPADVTGVCPTILPPLRTDTPTLVVGRMKKALKQIDFTITGKQMGRKADLAIQASEKVLAPDLDNFFLVSMIDQWAHAKEFAALLRADRALSNAYENTRLNYLDKLESAQMALEENQLDAAHKLFTQARSISPAGGEADAGIKIVDRLKDGTLTRDTLKKQFAKRNTKVDQVQNVNGKQQWVKVDLVELAQNDDKAGAKNAKPEPGIGGENLIKEHRDRQAVEEQKIVTSVEDAIRQARRTLPLDPDGTLDNLRTLLNRVKDHPDLGGQIRDALATRLQTALRESAKDVQLIKLRKQELGQGAATVQANLTAEQERKSFVERIESQFNVYKNLMNVGRFEERTKAAIVEAMVQLRDEARTKGMDIPIAAKAMYDISLAAYPLQKMQSIVRQREEKWLAVLMNVEKSHMPYPDEPGIYFPPLPMWKAIIKARKDKYSVTTLPNDENGIKEANEIYRLLQQPIETKGLQDVTLKLALEFFSDKFQGKLPILIDKEAFLEGAAEAPDLYEEKINLPTVPSKMPMGIALRLIIAQATKSKGTYLIRRSFVEITTNERYLADKVLRVYPVGDLVVPISSGQQGMQGGAGNAGVAGMAGMGGMAGMQGMGGMMGMQGMAGMQGMGGMMGMAGMQGMGGMMGMQGMQGMGMGMMGMQGMGMGMGGMGMGMMGQPGGNFAGGAFQGGFNGSLGVQGATQAVGLIDIITRIVDPGNWNKPPVIQPFAMGGGFPGAGMFGMVGMVGMMGMGMVGAGPPPDPTVVPPDPQTANSIDFFPPALALIIRAPSRMHSSFEGGIIGGKAKRVEGGVLADFERKVLAQADKNNNGPKVKVGGVAEDNNQAVLARIKQRDQLEPTKVWQEAFAKGGASPAMVIATADFLFEAGEFKHAAEFLKANLRYGVVTRPWVFEALAVALEASGGDPEEIRRVRLSGIALDPDDAQGFLSAARAMADRGQHDRALAFCRQAALLEPNDYHSYESALAYAESAKDVKGMEWAVGKLVSQDWPVDNLMIQTNARKRLDSLATTLKSEKRGDEANSLKAALQRLNQRDLIVRLIWDNAGMPSELEMTIKEPAGSICNLEQKQSPGGGIMIGYNLTDKAPNSQYIVAQGFSGEYEINVARVYGQPLGNRARLEIIQNAGTPEQTRRLEIIRLDQNAPIKVRLKDGRRTDLATVSPAANQRHTTKVERETSAFNELRSVANPNFFGAVGPRGSAGTGGPNVPSVASLAARDSKSKAAPTTVSQNAINPVGGGVQMTTQVRLSADQRSMDMVIRPFFQSVTGSGRASNLSVVPGGGAN